MRIQSYRPYTTIAHDPVSRQPVVGPFEAGDTQRPRYIFHHKGSVFVFGFGTTFATKDTCYASQFCNHGVISFEGDEARDIYLELDSLYPSPESAGEPARAAPAAAPRPVPAPVGAFVPAAIRGRPKKGPPALPSSAIAEPTAAPEAPEAAP